MSKVVKLKLHKYLKERSITRYALSKKTGMSFQNIDNYYKNKIVRYDSYNLTRICEALDCDISDILEYAEDE